MAMAVETPDTGFPDNVLAFTTTREGGISSGPWRSLNLASHVGDSPVAVAGNRRILHSALPGNHPVAWLDQVHGTRVVDAAVGGNGLPADASICHQPVVACAVLTADCLPVLLCERSGSVIAAAHAGWRGLAGGVLDATVTAMGCEPADLMAWLGPCIGPLAFEVGAEVREAFCADAVPAQAAAIRACFRPAARAGHFLADLHALARWRLTALGVASIAADSRCTVSSPLTFFSYRRDGVTGRMASMIIIKD